jgi:hypothetical protein
VEVKLYIFLTLALTAEKMASFILWFLYLYRKNPWYKLKSFQDFLLSRGNESIRKIYVIKYTHNYCLIIAGYALIVSKWFIVLVIRDKSVLVFQALYSI